jgi:ATP-dependent helicase/nuclease subunit A
MHTLSNHTQNHPLSDDEKCRKAMDLSQSFIIQAPAGSGKTELLIQRYMKALTHATHAPEQVLAITFTKKAAQEMKNRVLLALSTANDPKKTAHEQHTAQIAQALLKRSKQSKWSLLNQPQRLNIMTFDAYASYITRHRSNTDHQEQNLSPTPEQYYKQAALALMETQDDQTLQQHQIIVLKHLDNRLDRFVSLCCYLLSQREQWISHLIQAQSSPAFERLKQDIKHVTYAIRKQARDAWTTSDWKIAMQLWAYQCANQPQKFSQDDTKLCDLNHAPQSTWQQFASAWITQKKTWRQTVTNKHGFLAPSKQRSLQDKELAKDMKNQRHMLLKQLEKQPQVLAGLIDLMYAPDPDDLSNTTVLHSLSILLPRLVAQLKVIMAQEKTYDFTEISGQALQVLTDSEHKNNLALKLDQQLEHILIDEFQDTSMHQFRLIHAMLEGFTEDEGRSLFLVGDPMQSIYRFRQAEVGLFVHVAEHGISALRLNYLTLTHNYRSAPQVLNTINRIFSHIMPKYVNRNYAAIPYTPAKAMNQHSGSCHFHGLTHSRDLGELTRSIITAFLSQNPMDSIGVLGATRQHLAPIMQALDVADIPYHAKEMMSLNDNLSVRDVHILTCFYCQPDAPQHWLALCRTPWLGLKLDDIAAITHASQGKNRLDLLANNRIPGLSKPAEKQLKQLMPVLHYFITQRADRTLSEWIELFCETLGGVPICDFDPVKAYFDCLDKIPDAAFQLSTLNDMISALHYSKTPKQESNLHIMTIHQAKGLAFDAVILPGLEKTARHDTTPLIQWAEWLGQNQSHLVLSPMPAVGGHANATQRFLSRLNEQKNTYERQRLLYVAATRTRKQLHFIATLPEQDEQPAVKSPLRYLWPMLKDEWQIHTPDEGEFVNPSKQPNDEPDKQGEKTEHKTAMPFVIKSINRDKRPIHFPDQLPYKQHDLVSSAAALTQEQHAGNILHEVMQSIAEPYPLYSKNNIKQLTSHVNNAIKRLGLDQKSQLFILDLWSKTCLLLRDDSRLDWILKKHPEAKSEYAIESCVDKTLRTHIIDRFFWDETDECFWVIDYKTQQPWIGESVKSHKARLRNTYQTMMGHYVTLIQSMHPHKSIRWGLYGLCSGIWVTKDF